jgi:hypothetical protein
VPDSEESLRIKYYYGKHIGEDQAGNRAMTVKSSTLLSTQIYLRRAPETGGQTFVGLEAARKRELAETKRCKRLNFFTNKTNKKKQATHTNNNEG